MRDAFSIDVDRILHSQAYTSYIDKTQVFYLVGHHHITHRVIHVQLVSRIARTIGRALRLNEDLIEAIAAQAGGSPLFAEELARLAAQGREALAAPTIEAAIQVHLDALDEDVRDVAQKLSVFGLLGWDAALADLGVRDPGQHLRTLVGTEVLVEHATSRFKDTREFSFKHALTREVAYASIGEDSLKDLHTAAGRWLAKMGEDDATVARHLELGGQPIEASTYVERAARRALAANALQEAVQLAEKALAFAEEPASQFARAQILDEAWNRLDARAGERDSAVRAMQDAVYDQASDIRARGARMRYEDACGGGPDTTAGLDEVRRAAQGAGLHDEEVRNAAALAAR